MKIVSFKKSNVATIGTELELQIINPKSFSLVSGAKDLIRKIQESKYKTRIKPEITQSMIELNSSIHRVPIELLKELIELKNFLLEQARELQISFCGGGTHPFYKWEVQKIFPNIRYKKHARRYRYLSKRATIFGQHIHIGCGSGDDALYLTHALARFVPHFIAISASSPFYQSIDTGFYSTRTTILNAYPLSGYIPYIKKWDKFSNYFYKMKNYGIISSMKDFYWDIRPKPEFGTVEIRICDTPLTIKKAVMIVAYIQALSLYLLEKKPLKINRELYYLYNYNRFQASRYCFEGEIIDPFTSERKLICDDILEWLKKIERCANHLNTMAYLSLLYDIVINKRSDTDLLRKFYKQYNSLPKVVEQQNKIFIKEKLD